MKALATSLGPLPEPRSRLEDCMCLCPEAGSATIGLSMKTPASSSAAKRRARNARKLQRQNRKPTCKGNNAPSVDFSQALARSGAILDFLRALAGAWEHLRQ